MSANANWRVAVDDPAIIFERDYAAVNYTFNPEHFSEVENIVSLSQTLLDDLRGKANQQQVDELRGLIEQLTTQLNSASQAIQTNVQAINNLDLQKLNKSDLTNELETDWGDRQKTYRLINGQATEGVDEFGTPCTYTVFKYPTGWPLGTLFQGLGIQDALPPQLQNSYGLPRIETENSNDTQFVKITFQSRMGAFPDDLVNLGILRINNPSNIATGTVGN